VIKLLELLDGAVSASIVARTGSLRAATREAGVSFRKLHNKIEYLEETLGFRVFHRTPDGIVLTRDGRLVIEEASRLEAVVMNIVRMSKAINNDAEGEVLLATTEGLGTFWLSPQLGMFSAKNRGVSIRMNPTMSLADMNRFDVDLALQVVEPTLEHIKRIKLGKLHMVLAASQEYIDRQGLPKDMADLENHSFVFQASPQSTDIRIIENALGKSLKQSQIMIMRNSTAHYLTVEKGLGIGFLPSYIFALGTKVLPLQVPLRHELDIWLCFHEDARRTIRIARVIEWLVGIFDPRLFPWFRKQFVAPKHFAPIINENGINTLVDDIKLMR
jgi:molybdate transport repressor ModE-like protein